MGKGTDPTSRAAFGPGSAPRVGDFLGGRYELQELVGFGSAGNVFRARCRGTGDVRAIKVLHAFVGEDPEILRRFHREARATRSLRHPNIARVHDIGDDRGSHYLVMEYVPGESLADRLGRHPDGVPVGTAIAIFDQVLRALEAAHGRGIVHRDLKPGNVILAEDDAGASQVKLVDFGLARLADSTDGSPTLTRPRTVAGTPAYMAPEQCRTLKVGPAADLYAAGCLLTALLQGKPPFTGDAYSVMRRQMRHEPPLLPPLIAASVPPGLEALRGQLLEKDPERRPPSALAARQRLKALDRMPLSSAPPASLTRSVPSSVPPLVRVSLESAEAPPDDLVRQLAREGIVVAEKSPPAVRLWLHPTAPPTGEVDLRDCPTVVVVASLSSATLDRWIDVGATDVVRWPVTPEDLAKRVRRAAGYRR